ncbi:unnamed protein product, partial [Prorocentrum cordatum]
APQQDPAGRGGCPLARLRRRGGARGGGPRAQQLQAGGSDRRLPRGQRVHRPGLHPGTVPRQRRHRRRGGRPLRHIRRLRAPPRREERGPASGQDASGPGQAARGHPQRPERDSPAARV